ncbi:LssY C-terminal domain-containing protein [Methylocapsa sp. S129]|uniref:LssY C-terminal domain-containing protein n=1 Tax=Methylocapsa sp. S129 TaxID=1641869 RepID=UPI00131D4C67|nr:LssY C-terminal domain-containing protein [Methylocapsa sp. S129]
MTPQPPADTARRRLSLRLCASAFLLCLAAYIALAYWLAPFVWRHFEHQKAIADLPMTTFTAQGIPGDAINVGLEGSQEDVVCSMNAAGWSPADPVTFKSSLKIIGSVLFSRPYPQAPVSDLFYQGRREDLAFEKPSGKSADTRHHVRFWKVIETGDNGEPIWLGAATFDRGVGISHYTGQVTHHIAPDIDAERDLISSDLATADKVADIYETSGIGPTLNGRNGGDDRYYTDGEILFSRLAGGCQSHFDQPVVLSSPPAIEAKNRFWGWLKGLIGGGKS